MARPQCVRLLRKVVLAGSLLVPLCGYAADQNAATSSSEPAQQPASNSANSSAELYLEVTLNGHHSDALLRVLDQGGDISADADDLRKLGIRVPARLSGDVRLESIVSLTYRYERLEQQLYLSGPADLIDLPALQVGQGDTRPPGAPQPGSGVLVNYDLYAARSNGGYQTLSALPEVRAFGAWGIASTTALWRRVDSPGIASDSSLVRLDSSFSRSFTDALTTLRVGDSVSGSTDWSRATRFGGIQLQRNFALQPNLVRNPVPQFFGQAALPSSVDLYVNGLRQYSGQVPGGPFQINTVPAINGAGVAQMVVTDALGRQTVTAFPFYGSNELLKRGLSDWSVEAGFVRRNYGLTSWDYDSAPMVSGTYRRGIDDSLTAESHVEVTRGVALVGAGVYKAFGQAGVANVSLAASNGGGASGRQLGVGYSWRYRWFNVGVDHYQTFGDFRDVASTAGLAPPQHRDTAIVGATLPDGSSLGLNYLRLKYTDQSDSRYAGLFYFKTLGPRLTFNASLNQNLVDHSDRTLFMGLTWTLEDRQYVGTSLQRDRAGTSVALETARTAPYEGGLGYLGRVTQGADRDGALAQLDYRSRYGQATAGVQRYGSTDTGYLGWSGSAVFMNGSAFASRRIDDAFAVVSTEGIPDVPVLHENRLIGQTDSHGNLLVTPLNAYQSNHLSIDPLHLPADVKIDRVDADAVPADRAGTLVRFGIHPIRAATVILQDSAGEPLPVGSSVRYASDGGLPAVVGFDGEVWLDNLEQTTALTVQTPRGSCRTQVEFKRATSGELPVIGPLTCAPQT